jgi:sulfoacetaldehyde dehydrogenase
MSAILEMDNRLSSADVIANDLMRRARTAQQAFADADQARVDEAVRARACSGVG